MSSLFLSSLFSAFLFFRSLLPSFPASLSPPKAYPSSFVVVIVNIDVAVVVVVVAVALL